MDKEEEIEDEAQEDEGEEGFSIETPNRPHISNFEWGFVLTIIGVVDAIEFAIEALDLTGIGILIAVVVTGLIDILVGLSLFMYFLLRGVPMNWSRSLMLLGGFLLELFPFVGGAPLWTIDVALIMLSVKASEGSVGAGVLGKMAGLLGRQKTSVTDRPLLPSSHPELAAPSRGPTEPFGPSGRRPGQPPPIPNRPPPIPRQGPPPIPRQNPSSQPPPIPKSPPPLPRTPPPIPQQGTQGISARSPVAEELRQKSEGQKPEIYGDLRKKTEEQKPRLYPDQKP